MAKAKNKTVRFTQVVEQSGEPRVHTLWLPPNKDPELQRALKSNRVMTVQTGAAGGKTDFGAVGFEEAGGRSAQLLVFPKSLKRFEGARIVGIKFDLVAQPKLDAVDPLKHTATPSRHLPKKPPAQPLPTARNDSEAKTSRNPQPSNSKERETPSPAVVPFEIPEREVDRKPAAAARPPRSSSPPTRRATLSAKTTNGATASPTEAALIREIRAAMKELERGKSVAAFQRLERAVSKTEK